MIQKNVLEIKNLSVSFALPKGRLRAVRGVSLQVGQGETLGIVGESGSGKSVTIKSILRLLAEPPSSVDSGEILFEGEDILHMTGERLRRLRGGEIGMVFQNPMTAFNPVIPVGRQIGEALEFHERLSRQERDTRVLRLLEEVGISHPEYRIKQYPHEFSGGMLQRAMIASSLISSPRLILADEPTTGLDVTIQDQILKLIRKLRVAREMSLIWITHDLSLLAGFADRIAVMYAGRIVEEACADELYTAPLHPYTLGMLLSVPTLATCRNAPLYSIPGLPPNPSDPDEGCAFAVRCSRCMEICRQKRPPEHVAAPGHRVSCWLYAPQGGAS